MGSLSPLPLPTTKADLATPAAECLTHLPNTPMLRPQYITILLGNLTDTKWEVDYSISFNSRRSINSYWLELSCVPGMDFPFLSPVL